jgi:ACS family hexuronate transporter-like MFS transporter
VQTTSEHERRKRYLLVALVFFGTVLAYVDRQVLALLKPTLEATFGWSDADFAHLGSAFSLAMAGSVFFAGLLVDRFGVRLVYGWAVGLWSLAGMAHAAAASVGQFVTARVGLAVGESVAGPATIKATAKYLPAQERSIGLGIIASAPSIGAIVTPLVIPLVAVAYGWRAAFILTGGLGFVWIVLWYLATRGLDSTPADRKVAAPEPIDWRGLFGDRRTWALTFTKALADMVWWFMLFWIPDLFSKVYHLSQAELGGPVALTYAMAGLGALVSGLMFPALMRRGLSFNAARKTVMVVFGSLILPVPFALYMGSPWLAALLIGLALFAHNGFVTNIFGMTADMVPLKRVGTVTAMSTVAGNLTGMAMIEFAGWSLSNGHGYWPMFVIASGAYLAATALMHWMIPVLTYRRDSEGSAA